MTFNQAQFARVVETAKAKTTDRRWLAAIDKAAAGIASGWWIITELAHGVAVTTECGKTYFASEDACQCRAFELGQPCKHRALVRLVEMMETAPVVDPSRSAPRIVRSIERDPANGSRVQVVKVDGWYV